MATELDSRIWIKDLNYKAKDEFVKLIASISQLTICTNEWNNLSVVGDRPGNKLLELDQVQIGQISGILDGFVSDNCKYSINVPVDCWRFNGTEAKREHVVMVVSCWGKDYGEKIGLDHDIEGQAQISILNAGPFVELLKNNDSPEVKKINSYVEENTDTYVKLLLHISETIYPKKILTFTDAGQYLIVNAHIAFYERSEILIEDLIYFKNLMRSGNENYHISPISKLDSENKNFVFHEWRNKELQLKLKNQIIDALAVDYNVTSGHIINVLKEGKIDYFDKNGHFLVLDYPYFLNNFLSGFYLDLLNPNPHQN